MKSELRIPKAAVCLLVSVLQPACVQSLATGLVADAFTSTGSVFASEEDPELVRDAVPFGLKTMEGLLTKESEHEGLLLALASGFTQYAYAFVEQEADRIGEDDIEASAALNARAYRLYLRAQRYGMRLLEVRHPGFAILFQKDREAALSQCLIEDVPALYWTAAPWGLAIGSSGLDPELVAELPSVTALIERALALDPDWNEGSLHEMFVAIEASQPQGDLARAERHFDRAVALSKGHRAGVFVLYAEKIAVRNQDRPLFDALIQRALEVDEDRVPDERLRNVIAKRRARWLSQRAEDLFM
jgi:predicted anti-sigma-YlaC factor YlaD